MISNFINYKAIITYEGRLDSEMLGETLLDLKESLPATVDCIKNSVELCEYFNKPFVLVDLLFYLTEGLFSDAKAKEDYIKKLKLEWDSSITKTLNQMSIIYSLETF